AVAGLTAERDYTVSSTRKRESAPGERNKGGAGKMAATADQRIRQVFIDKTAIRKIVAEQNQRMGFVPDPMATPQKAREMMRALGIRPEDNLGSRGIISARDEE